MASLACSLVIFIFLLLLSFLLGLHSFLLASIFFFFCLEGGNVGMCSDVMYVRCMRGMLRASS